MRCGIERVTSTAPHHFLFFQQRTQKRAGTGIGSRPIGRSELVEHGAMHRVHHTAGQMRRQGVVVTLVQGEVS